MVSLITVKLKKIHYSYLTGFKNHGARGRGAAGALPKEVFKQRSTKPERLTGQPHMMRFLLAVP